MRAGALRHRVAIQNRPTSTPGSRGQETAAYVTVATVWAEVIFGNENETDTANQRTAQKAYQVRLRYTPLVSEQSKIVYAGRTLSVVSVNNVEGRNRELILICTDSK